MKTIRSFLYMIPLTIFLNLSCEEQAAKIEEPIVEVEVPPIKNDENGNIAIIGINPCTFKSFPIINSTPNRGYIVKIIATSDTVTCYTLPLAVAKQIDRSLDPVTIKFKEGILLPEDKVLKITLPFRYASEKEIIVQTCTMDIIPMKYPYYDKKQIIITSGSK